MAFNLQIKKVNCIIIKSLITCQIHSIQMVEHDILIGFIDIFLNNSTLPCSGGSLKRIVQYKS